LILERGTAGARGHRRRPVELVAEFTDAGPRVGVIEVEPL